MRLSAFDLGWLAGYLEAEGWFGAYHVADRPNRKPIIGVNSTDQDVVQKLAALFGRNWNGPYKPSGSLGKKLRYSTRLTDSAAVALARKLQPFMGVRRRQQIDKMLATRPQF